MRTYQIRLFIRYIFELFVNGICGSYLIPLRLRRCFYNLTGMKVHGYVHAHCYFHTNNFILGRNSYLNKNCIIDNGAAAIIIGNNVSIGYNVQLYTTNHDTTNPNKRGGKVIGAGIIIEDGVWIGANAIILPGTYIKKGCVVGAGAIVRSELMENTLYVGNKAQLKKLLNNE